MGYIFDAIKRGGDAKRSPKQSKPVSDESLADEIAQAASHGADLPDVGPLTVGSQPQEVAAVDHDHDTPATLKFDPAAASPQAEPIAPHDEDDDIALRVDSAARKRYDERLVPLTDPGCLMAEEYRSIRTGILARWEHRRHLVHTITSATPQEGKTLTTVNLGLTFAELRNRRTIIVEADLRLPQFRNLMGGEETPGLVGLLEGQARLADCVQKLEDSRVSVLPAGRRVRNKAVGLLSSPEMANLLATLRKEYDHVLIDTPPVIELADAGILGAMSDDVLLIARMNRTPRPLIEQAMRVLTSYNAPVAGLIGTDQSRSRRKYYYAYRYGYREQNRYYAKAA